VRSPGVHRKWWWWTRRSSGRRASTRSGGSTRRWTRGTRRSLSIASSPTPRSACVPRPTTPRPRSRGTAATPSAASRWHAATRYASATTPSPYAPTSLPSSSPSPWYAPPSLWLDPIGSGSHSLPCVLLREIETDCLELWNSLAHVVSSRTYSSDGSGSHIRCLLSRFLICVGFALDTT